MSPKPQLRATVKFLPHAEGGRYSPPISGVKPHLKVGDIFTSCYVWGEAPEQEFSFGVECDVRLELLFWNEYKDSVHVGMPVQLNEAGRVVGVGKITEFIEPDQQRTHLQR